MPTITPEFLQTVKANLRPEGRDEAVWAHLHDDENIEALLVALQSIHADVTRQLAASDPEDEEWAAWRKKANGFRLHVEDYIRQTKLAVADARRRRHESSAQASVTRLKDAIRAHREALLSSEEDEPTDADEALWALLDDDAA